MGPLNKASSSTTPDAVSVATEPVSDNGLNRFSFHAFDTSCAVYYEAPFGSVQTNYFEEAAITWVAAFEAKYSRFIPTSLISRINAAAGYSWIAVDEETDRLLGLCETLFSTTQGRLDPTGSPLMELWNGKASSSTLPAIAEINAARKLVGWTKVRRSRGRIFLPIPRMVLDFGGFGKEYAVDSVIQIALDHGITHAFVDFGGKIRVLGAPPHSPAWNVRLHDSAKAVNSPERIAVSGSRGVASCHDSIRSSKPGKRRYSHIIDPRTGWPVANGCLQATIVANTCLQASVLSTTAFMQGLPHGLELIEFHPGAEGLIITETSRAQTRGFHRHVA